MGACSSKKSKNDNNSVSIASIFKSSNNNSNTPVSPKVKSDFYFFIYDSEKKKYHIADRDTLEDEFPEIDFMTAVNHILRIE